jgi:hypothetical protein
MEPRHTERLTPPCLPQIPRDIMAVHAEVLVRQLRMLITPSQKDMPHLRQRLGLWALALEDWSGDSADSIRLDRVGALLTCSIGS